MSAVLNTQVPHLDSCVLRALEALGAQTVEELAHYLGVEMEPLDLALQRLGRRLVRHGKLLSVPLAHVAAHIEQPEEVPEPRRLAPGGNLGSAQRLILALLGEGPMTAVELQPLVPTDGGTIRRGLAAMEYKGLVRRQAGPQVRGKPVLRWALTDKGRRVPAC